MFGLTDVGVSTKVCGVDGGGEAALGVGVADALPRPSVHYCIGDSGRQHTSPLGNVNTLLQKLVDFDIIFIYICYVYIYLFYYNNNR